MFYAGFVTDTMESFRCPPGWFFWNESCYYTKSGSFNYFKVQEMCAQKLASLVDIKSPEENQFVEDILHKMGYAKTFITVGDTCDDFMTEL